MKTFSNILLCSFTAYAAVSAVALPARGGRGKAAAGGGAATAALTGDVTRGADTIVLKEVGGIPGNECLTFRNNGTFSKIPSPSSPCPD